MARTCTICRHDEREAIDNALVRGVSLRDIAAQWQPLTASSLSRHRRDHLSPALAAVQAERVEQGAASLVDRVESLIGRTEGLLTAAEQDGRVTTALAAVRELRGLLDLYGKASGELDDRPQVTVNLLASPEWLSVRDAVLGALTGYPDARQVVAGRLLELGAGS
jgi:hypothetical protein